MKKDEVMRLIKEHDDILLDEYGVSKIGIFGSVLKGVLADDSDLDIVVEFRKPIGFKFNGFVEYLENMFGRKVDVVTTEGLKNIRVKEVMKNIEKDVVYV